MTYKLPEKISTAKWLSHVLIKNKLRAFKINFLYPLRKRLKRQFIVDTTIVPSPKVLVAEMENIEHALFDAQKARNERLAQRLEGKKEILRWIINYER